jgi:hypothetical protein
LKKMRQCGSKKWREIGCFPAPVWRPAATDIHSTSPVFWCSQSLSSPEERTSVLSLFVSCWVLTLSLLL